RCVVENVAILLVEIGIIGVPYLQHPFFDTERISVIFAYLMFRDFDGLVIEILTVEKRDPCWINGSSGLLFAGWACATINCAGEDGYQSDGFHGYIFCVRYSRGFCV